MYRKTTKDGHVEMTEEEVASFLKAQADAVALAAVMEREQGIQALARKKLEEEYDAMTEQEKEKLLK